MIFYQQLARQVGVCVCCFYIEQDGTFRRLFVPPTTWPDFHGQSISWIINADGVGELIEPVQINAAPVTPTPATTDPILEPLPRSPSSTTRRPLPRYQRRQINNDDLIVSIDRVGLKLADCLSIAE